MRITGFHCPWNPSQGAAWFGNVLMPFSLYMSAPFVFPYPWNLVVSIAYAVAGAASLVTCVVTTATDAAHANVIAKRDKTHKGRSYEPETSHCTLCHVDVGPRTKHCRVCDKCIDVFDHHCKWLNTCIGKRNYGWFLVYVISTLAASLVQLAAGVAALVLVITDFSGFIQQTSQAWPVMHPFVPTAFALGGLLLAAVVSAMLAHLAIFHLYLICTGQTTYEHIVAERLAAKAREAALQEARLAEAQRQRGRDIEMGAVRRPSAAASETEAAAAAAAAAAGAATSAGSSRASSSCCSAPRSTASAPPDVPAASLPSSSATVRPIAAAAAAAGSSSTVGRTARRPPVAPRRNTMLGPDADAPPLPGAVSATAGSSTAASGVGSAAAGALAEAGASASGAAGAPAGAVGSVGSSHSSSSSSLTASPHESAGPGAAEDCALDEAVPPADGRRAYRSVSLLGLRRDGAAATRPASAAAGSGASELSALRRLDSARSAVSAVSASAVSVNAASPAPSSPGLHGEPDSRLATPEPVRASGSSRSPAARAARTVLFPEADAETDPAAELRLGEPAAIAGPDVAAVAPPPAQAVAMAVSAGSAAVEVTVTAAAVLRDAASPVPELRSEPGGAMFGVTSPPPLPNAWATPLTSPVTPLTDFAAYGAASAPRSSGEDHHALQVAPTNLAEVPVVMATQTAESEVLEPVRHPGDLV